MSARPGALLVLALAALAAAGCPKREGRVDRAGSDSHVEPARGAQPAESEPSPALRPAEPGPALDAVFEERRAEREAMVRAQMESRDISDPRVLAALRKVVRHRFVPEGERGEAYADRPLPIGHGQTISQPYIVAFMTQTVAPKLQDKCLEIGTGSGYQAAVLAELCKKTYSIEYLPEVARFGASNLRALGYGKERVELRVGDGYRGWPEAQPFQVIVVTAAPDHVPKPLLEQLAVGGRLVIPVGPSGDQELVRWTRIREGSDDRAFRTDTLMGVRFVPFLGDAAAGGS
jgi:protein-L-isoaspartate(D-aspartate) O-methyltransferase